MIWIFHFIVITMLYFIAKKNKRDKFFYYSTFIYSIFIFGQRWMTGVDFPNYLLYYLIDFQSNEIGYFGLQTFLSNRNIYFGILIFIIFLISMFNNYRLIIRFDKNTKLLIFLFLISEVFFMQMSQIRQLVAISFFINAYYFAFNRRYIRSMLNSILALSFHISTVFLIPFIFLKIPISRKIVFFMLLFCFLLPVIDISFILNSSFFSSYSSYLGSAYDVPLGTFHYFRYYLILIIFIAYTYSLKKFNVEKIDSLIFNGILFYSLFYGLSFQFAPMLRISNYFKIFEIIFVAYYIKDLNWKLSTKLVVQIIITFFVGNYIGNAIVDPYLVTRYEFRPLQIYDTKSKSELFSEIYRFDNQ